jgi:hypothetical protein
VNGRALGLARYRFAATWRARWGAYLTLILLIGALGGLAIGAVAGARRTQSSYATFLASTNPSTVGIGTAILDPLIGNGEGYNPHIINQLSRLPHVTRVASGVGIDMAPLTATGAPIAGSGDFIPVAAGNALGSVGGEGFTVDRWPITAGHEATRADQFVTTKETVAAFGWHVGEIIEMGIYTNAQTEAPGFGTARVQPMRRIAMTLTGIAVSPTSIVEDDADFGSPLGLVTPALTRQLLTCCVNYTETALQVADPAENLSALDSLLTSFSAHSAIPLTYADVTAIALGKTDRAVKPLSLALGVFGAIAAVAALLIAGQFLGRQLRLRAEEADVLRAIGASPTAISADGLFGPLGAVFVGAVLAFGVAVALSPLAPLGPVRSVYPTPGVAFDWTVLAGGFAVLLVGLSAVAVWLTYRAAPHRLAERARLAVARPSVVAQAVTASGLSVSAATGVRFALEPGSGRTAVPVRSAILGATLAVVVVVTTVVFGASLDRLVSTPALYGWNWNYILLGGGGSGDIPLRPATQALSADHDIAAYAAGYFALLAIDGQAEPILGTTPGAPVQPPVLSGHGLEGRDQVVLGTQTLAQLHKTVGDSVNLDEGGTRTASLHIVGTATFPALADAGAQHLEMGQGALVSDSLLSASARNPFDDPLAGPEAFFVRFRAGVNTQAAERRLAAIAKPLSNAANFGVFPTAVERPAEIVDYKSMGRTPAILGASLGVGAVVALGLTLLASVRRRRRDLALLKTLGFTSRQLGLAVASQATVAVAIGAVVGIPLGIVIGRLLWDLFARGISAVPSPSVPLGALVLIALGSLVLANVVAALPGRIAARTPTAFLLRSD